MRDMFYNYDSAGRRNKKTYPISPAEEVPDTLYSDSTASIIHNVRGDEIGIRAYKDRDNTLYFQLFGTVEDEETGESVDYIEYLNHCELTFELIDAHNRSVFKKKYFKVVDDFGVVKIELPYTDLYNAGIKKDIYRISLKATYIPENGSLTDPQTFVLFYENDATISFI